MLHQVVDLLRDEWPGVFALAHLLVSQLVGSLIESVDLNLKIVDPVGEEIILLVESGLAGSFERRDPLMCLQLRRGARLRALPRVVASVSQSVVVELLSEALLAKAQPILKSVVFVEQESDA